MTTLADAGEFLAELISQLFHADVFITEQAERIEALEAEIVRLRSAFGDTDGAAAHAAAPVRKDSWVCNGSSPAECQGR